MDKKITFWLSCIVALLIGLSPFLLYLHNLIPKDIENFETFFGTIKGGQFELAQVYVFMFFNKFVPLFLLVLLYVTNKNWWSQVILIPISTYIFQLISIVVSSESTIDEIEFIYVIPITVIILIPLYLIRKNFSIYLHALDLKKEMETIIKKQKNK